MTIAGEITVHTDKNGVVREYRAEQRKARVGELVKVVEGDEMDVRVGNYANGDIFEVVDIRGTDDKAIIDTKRERHRPLWAEEYVTLVPTDVIHYDGKRWKTIKRDARVDDYILVVNAHATSGQYDNGSILTVREVAMFTTCGIEDVFFHGSKRLVEGNEYVVLEALDDSIVVHEGRRYRKVQRKANVGETILITNWTPSAHIPIVNRTFTNGDVVNVAGVAGPHVVVAKNGEYAYVNAYEYVVLEPLPDVALASSTPVSLTGGPSWEDCFKALEASHDALAKRVARMDTQLRVVREDIVLIEEGAGDEIDTLKSVSTT